MIWLIVVILGIVLIVSISKGNKKKNLEIEQIKRDLDKKPDFVEESASVSVSDELIKLKKLLDEAVITQEEFDKQKAKLLS